MPTNPWERIVKFNDKTWPDWRQRDPFQYSNALLGELGEMANALKHSIGGGTNLKKGPQEYLGDVQEELADVFIYLVLMAERMGMDRELFERMVLAKMDKNERRIRQAPCKDCSSNVQDGHSENILCTWPNGPRPSNCPRDEDAKKE